MSSAHKLRHCAFCLEPIIDQAIKVCGKCLKRSYCSQKCQTMDWSAKGEGQGHKNWCHLECGEEDLDWEVATVEGKGLGVIAKRKIAKYSRIIVDACRPKNHPAIKDLMPLNGTNDEKFKLNCLGCGADDDEDSVLCLRISRANHRCDANADHIYDETYKVVIMFATKDIQEGEEVCINYALYNDISRNISAERARRILKSTWGIICPNDCFCYNKQMEKVIAKSKELDFQINILGSQGTPRSADAALEAVKELLENHEVINSSWTNKTRTLFDGFQIAVMRRKTLKQAQDFIRKAYDVDACIMSPTSARVLRVERYVKDIRSHNNYLTLD